MENPQAKSILERIHQVLANLVCAFSFQNNHLNEYENLNCVHRLLVPQVNKFPLILYVNNKS